MSNVGIRDRNEWLIVKCFELLGCEVEHQAIVSSFAGNPDLKVKTPGNDRPMLVEAKNPRTGGALTPQQVAYHETMKEQGVPVYVVQTVGDIVGAIADHLDDEKLRRWYGTDTLAAHATYQWLLPYHMETERGDVWLGNSDCPLCGQTQGAHFYDSEIPKIGEDYDQFWAAYQCEGGCQLPIRVAMEMAGLPADLFWTGSASSRLSHLWLPPEVYISERWSDWHLECHTFLPDWMRNDIWVTGPV